MRETEYVRHNRIIIGGILKTRSTEDSWPAKKIFLKATHLTAWVLVTLVLGLFGLFIAFGESFFLSNFATPMFILVSGVIIGYFNQKLWVLSGFAGWGGVLLTSTNLIGGAIAVNIAAGLFIFSIGPALLGGYLGKEIRKLDLFNS